MTAIPSQGSGFQIYSQLLDLESAGDTSIAELDRLSKYDKDAFEASKRVLKLVIKTTPLSSAVDQMKRVISLFDRRVDPQGLRVIGPSGAGKTTAVRLLRAQLMHQDLLGASSEMSILYTRLDHKESNHSLIRKGLHFFGHPLGSRNVRSETSDIKFELLLRSLRAKGTLCWIFDEAQNLFTTTRGRHVAREAQSAATDMIRSMSDRLRIPVVLVGTEALHDLENFDAGLASRVKGRVEIPKLSGKLWEETLNGYFTLLNEYADPTPLQERWCISKIDQYVEGEQRQLKRLMAEILAITVQERKRKIDSVVLIQAIGNLKEASSMGFSK